MVAKDIFFYLLYFSHLQDQYIFIHDALLEYIQSQLHGETEVKETHIPKYVMEDLQAEVEEGLTLLSKQYLVGIFVVLILSGACTL